MVRVEENERGRARLFRTTGPSEGTRCIYREHRDFLARTSSRNGRIEFAPYSRKIRHIAYALNWRDAARAAECLATRELVDSRAAFSILVYHCCWETSLSLVLSHWLLANWQMFCFCYDSINWKTLFKSILEYFTENWYKFHVIILVNFKIIEELDIWNNI